MAEASGHCAAPERYVGLIRGVNVGPTTKVAMSDLRELVAELGFVDVRTILNSGNVIFSATGTNTESAARRIEAALAATTGISARVMVFTAEEIGSAVAGNPLSDLAANPSRLLVAFLARAATASLLEPLLERDWAPEALALGERVAYLWCPDGVAASPVAQAVGKAAGDDVTMRSWATVLRLDAAAR